MMGLPRRCRRCFVSIILGELRREKFGAKSEKLRPDQYHLPLEDVEIAQGILDAAQERAEAVIQGRSRSAPDQTSIAIAAACRPICLGWNGSSSLRARSVRAVAIAIQYVVIVTRHSAVIRLRTKPIKARFNLTLLFKVTRRN